MVSRSRNAVVYALGAIVAFGLMVPLRASTTDVATLKRIASRVENGTGVISIEASDPVPYVASQPDPRTFIVELRNVVAGGFTNTFKVDPRVPVSSVRVENATAFDGAAITRVSVDLAEAVRPRVRSSKNVIYIEADRLDRAAPSVVSAVKTGTVTATTVRSDLNKTAPLDPIAMLTQAPPSAGQKPAAVLAQAAPPAAPNAFVPAAQAPAPQPVTGQAPPPAAQPQAPPAGVSPAPGVAPQINTTPARYTGHPVSLDFQGADLRAVLRTFAEISGLNIVIDPTIQGTVDVSLRDVPWDQALDIILRANKLGYVVDGTIVRIAPLSVLADEEGQRRKLQDEQALAGELRVMTKSLSYARAEDLRPLLTATVLSARGSIQTDVRTNTLIINDLPERLARADSLINTLDTPQPQVEIEARIIQTTRDFARTVGVQWGIGGRADNSLGNTTGLAFPNQGSITGRIGSQQGPPAPSQGFDSVPSVVNLPVNGASTAIGVALGSINGALNLDVALSALEKQGQGRILSTPRVTTQNNVEAEMTQGVQIPIQTVANNTVTVTFKDAALTLKVTPQITAANTIIMRVSIENAAPDFSKSINNIPPIDTQRAITQVLVNNGDTTVIGGIYVSNQQTNKDGTPGLSRLPLLGWLFKRDAVNDEDRELLIFITPRILTI